MAEDHASGGEKGGSKYGWLALLALVPASVPILYFLGKSYADGRVAAWGLDPGQFPSDINETILTGVFAIALMIVEIAKWADPKAEVLLIILPLVAFAAFLFVLGIWIIGIRIKGISAKKRLWLQKHLSPIPTQNMALFLSILICTVLPIFAIAMLLFGTQLYAIVGMSAERLGYEHGTSELHDLKQKLQEGKAVTMVNLFDARKNGYRGAALQIGEKYCALMVNGKVMSFPISAITSTDHGSSHAAPGQITRKNSQSKRKAAKSA